MILRLLHAGSRPSGPLDAAADEYRRRLERRHRVDEMWVRAARLKDASDAGVARALATEGERLLGRVEPRDLLIALDRQGETVSSVALARRFERWTHGGHRAVAFALGSAHGLAGDVLARARWVWSFGPLTLPHDLARVVLWEQLYRAASIRAGEPYHK